MVSYKEMKNLVQLICPSLTTPSIPISLKLVDRAEVEPWVAVMSLGLCAAIAADSLSIAESEVALFNPGVLAQLEALGVGQELRDIVHLGTELEDVVSLAPERLGESVAEIQALALEFLRGLGQAGQR